MRVLATCVCVSVFASALLARGPHDSGSHADDLPTAAPSAPATQPVAALLNGTYRGTVVDDDETVPCVTNFRPSASGIVGTYIVREGKERYEGTLDDYKLVSDARGTCQFRWHDKNGEGFVTIHVTSDGTTFEGSWGLEVVQDQLVWKGTRSDSPQRGTHGSHAD